MIPLQKTPVMLLISRFIVLSESINLRYILQEGLIRAKTVLQEGLTRAKTVSSSSKHKGN